MPDAFLHLRSRKFTLDVQHAAGPRCLPLQELSARGERLCDPESDVGLTGAAPSEYLIKTLGVENWGFLRGFQEHFAWRDRFVKESITLNDDQSLAAFRSLVDRNVKQSRRRGQTG